MGSDKTKQPVPDGISPVYYRAGEIEPIDFIRSQAMLYEDGNIVKYISRFRHRPVDKGLSDLLKARTYLNWLIEEWEKNLASATSEKGPR